MPCYHPIAAYRAASGPSPETGKWPLVFNTSAAKQGSEIVYIPCGQCIGCRLEKSRQWAIRCIHEKQMYENNCFITLTYEDIALPLYRSESLKKDKSKWKEDFVLFMKRLRRSLNDKIHFYHCGEYGESLGRPHHHAAIFNYSPEDKELLFETKKKGVYLYTSESLQRIWGLGNCTVGDVTFESAAYVARYIAKKITGEKAEKHYAGKEPEYATMSRRPGIGNAWLEQYAGDVYPSDEIIIRGNIKCKPPRYYDSLYDLGTENLDSIKLNRKEKIKKTTYQKLAVQEKIKEKRCKRLVRCMEVNS